jgi:hypothetical protein
MCAGQLTTKIKPRQTCDVNRESGTQNANYEDAKNKFPNLSK